jgi:hypothetical protein
VKKTKKFFLKSKLFLKYWNFWRKESFNELRAQGAPPILQRKLLIVKNKKLSTYGAPPILQRKPLIKNKKLS